MRWRSALGDAALEQLPALAWRKLGRPRLTGDTKKAERWAAFVNSVSLDLPVMGGFASFDSGRAMLRAAMCTSGPETMMVDAAFGASLEPAGSSARPSALALVGEAHLLLGASEQAHATFAEASDAGVRLASGTVVALSEAQLALLAMDQNKWQEARDHLALALTTIQETRIQDYVVSSLAYVESARFALHMGDREEIDRQLARAMRARPMATYVLPWLAVRLRLQVAKVYLAMAEPTPARHLLREIDDILVKRPALGVLVDQVEEFRQAATAGPAGPTDTPPLTSAELRLLPYLQTHLTLGVIAERLFVSRNTVSSQVTSIHRKLGAWSCQEAVEKAAALGLLGG